MPAGNVQRAKAEQIKRLVQLLYYRLEFGSIHIVNTSGYISEIEERSPFVEAAIKKAIAGRQAGLVRVQRR